jgi:Ca-activated chloride channel family protein
VKLFLELKLIYLNSYFIPLVFVVIGFLLSYVRLFKNYYYHGVIQKIVLPKSLMPIWFCLNMLLLLFSIAKPFYVKPYAAGDDYGVAMMLALDVSGSMAMVDDRESRFDQAKNAAINFIKKRQHDHLGLVLFGKVALTRCPITYDKEFLVKTLNNYKLGEINPQGTVLFQALLTSINRLKDLDAQSKVIILLTDGFPDGDSVPLELIMSLAQKFKIRIYTIGVGLESLDSYSYRHLGQRAKDLLNHIAKSTEGVFYNAGENGNVDEIYEAIDKLETSKNSYDVPVKKIDIDFIVALLFAISELLRRLHYAAGIRQAFF